MVFIPSLWLPILLSAIAVSVVSSIIHMLLGYPRSDFGRVPAEDDVREAPGPFEIPPGEHVIPHAGSAEEIEAA